MPLALDGDPTTAWETERYDTPDLGNIKEASACTSTRAARSSPAAIRIVTPKDGWDLRLYVRATRCRPT